MKVRTAPLITTLLGGAMLLSACGGAAAPPSSAPASKPASSAASAPASSAPAKSAAPASASAKASGSPHGNTLVYNIGDEPDSIDPAQDQDTTQDFVIMQLNDTLVYPDKDLNVKPGLAEKWEISPDGLTYTFHLRQGLKWSDGSPLTAKDFEYSFKRLFDPATASPYTDIVKGIKGSEEYFSSKSKDPAALAKLRDGVGVKAKDDNTLVITLKEPEAFFLTTLFNGATAPVNQANVEKNKEKAFDAPNYVGSGPFVLKTWAHKSKMELTANPNYYGPKPKINLQFVMIKETTATLAAYKNNEIDTDGGVGPSAADMTAITADPQLSKQVLKYTELGTFYLVYNVAKKPFDNVKVRQAINYAIDRNTLVNKVLAGQGEPAGSLIPPGMPGYLNVAPAAYDPNKAKAILADAGFADGKGLPQNIQASYNNLGVWGQVMQLIQANLKAAGISIQLDPRESKTYFKSMREDASPMYRAGWSSDYPDPDDWYRVIFLSTASQNYGHWKNAKYDQLVKQAAIEADQAKRLDMYKQAADIMANDPPATWWYYSKRFRLFKPWVHGIVTTGQDGGLPGKFFLKDVTIG
ncbi:MAG: peptide ABC transporter substrate-binding protein [Chloroflexota bacterium]|nr:peptide ABC transporter substrate-binding protein [Chloroflexota bacterium]